MSEQLEILIRDTQSRLVETLLSFDLKKEDPLRTLPDGVLFPLQLRGSLGKIDVPVRWMRNTLERIGTLKSLNLCRKDMDVVVASEFTTAIDTAARVTATLWSALEAHWGLSLSFKDFNEMTCNRRQLLRTCLWYVPMCGQEQEFIPFLKYQFAYLFAKAEGQSELPEEPKGFCYKHGRVMQDWIGQFFKLKCFGSSLRNKEWRNTVLHGIKKGLPQMGEFHLKKNCNAMKERLTKLACTPDYILSAVGRTAREIFPDGVGVEDWTKIDPFVGISDHACYERSRSERGVLGHLYELDEGCEPFRQISPSQLGGMYWDPSTGSTGEIRFPSWLPDSIYHSERRIAMTETVNGIAAVKPIFEPLKVRMISAGDYRSNGLYSRLQVALWKGLQRFPQFSLTGKGVHVSDLEWIREMTLKLHIPKHMSSEKMSFGGWVSGDYSAATDNLHSDASLQAIVTISRDNETFEVLKRGLMDTTIDFSKIELEGLPDPFVMTNGQLMGCVFSFIILCLINLALYRLALECFSGVTYRIEDLPVKTNGDDILFKANQEFYDVWSFFIQKVGFEKSMGKNYFSSKTAVINSTYFDVRQDKPVTKVPYLNMGWITGVKKGGGDEGVSSEEEYPIDKIRSQLDTTFDQWIALEEYRHEDISSENISRRNEVFKRYQLEMKRWNYDRAVALGAPLAGGPLGLGLINEPGEDASRDELRAYHDEEMFSYWAFIFREKKPSLGLSSVPKSLAPWKIAQRTSEWNYHPLRKEFRKYVRNMDEDTLFGTYMAELTQTRERKFNETRFLVGAL